MKKENKQEILKRIANLPDSHWIKAKKDLKTLSKRFIEEQKALEITPEKLKEEFII